MVSDPVRSLTWDMEWSCQNWGLISFMEIRESFMQAMFPVPVPAVDCLFSA